MTEATELIWHDVECGGYSQDLALWEELASASGTPVLDLGSGAGRVALHLARRGHEVEAVDLSPALVAALNERAGAESLPVRARVGDVRDLQPTRRYPLVIAPMQLHQLLGGAAARARAMRSIAGALAPHGLAALAIFEGGAVGDAGPDVLPDVREVGGWLYSSLPLGVHTRDGTVVSRRLRQAVSPDGRLTETQHEDALELLDAQAVEGEARAAGLAPAGVRRIAESELHMGSTVVLVRRDA